MSKKKNHMRYAAVIPSDYDQRAESSQEVTFAVEEILHEHPEIHDGYVVLPKKIDALIREVETLGLRVTNVRAKVSAYTFQFSTDANAKKSLNAGNKLVEMYSEHNCAHIHFTSSGKDAESIQYELMIDPYGTYSYPTNNPHSRYESLIKFCGLQSDLKECVHRIKEVRVSMKKSDKKKK